MPPDPPRSSPRRPAGPGKPARTPLVGGLPWLTGTPPTVTDPAHPGGGGPAPATPAFDDLALGHTPARDAPFGDVPFGIGGPQDVVMPQFDVVSPATAARRPAATPPRAPGMLVDILGAEEAADLASFSARLRARIDGWVQNSPPFTVSLCLHVIALIVLALFIVRIQREQRRPIDLSFAGTTVVEAEKPGVQIVEPEPEPEPEAEPEVKEQKPVEDPIAAPNAVDAEKLAALGAEPMPAAAPAIGSLLDGREEGSRERMVAAFGGSDATEAAVARALEWLARRQGKDGLWSLQGPYADGASQENRLAATAMALLAFQGAGNTPRRGIHRRAVDAAWTAILRRQVAGDARDPGGNPRVSGAGRFEISPLDPPARQALYTHAQVTIALCELYGMTRDAAYETPARRAVAYAVAAQGANGGWRYEPGQDGDMSVTGWFMMALKSAQMAGIDVPQATFDRLNGFLDGVAVGDGSRSGYRFETISGPVDAVDRGLVRKTAGPVTAAVSAEALLCRQYLGWPRRHPALTAGAETLLHETFLDWEGNKDVYAWYYVTQVVHHLGGPAWERWNGRMKELLPAVQVATGDERGSWDPALDKWGPWGGRLFTTCFCTYMLEVYYRHLPLYGAEAVHARSP